MLNLWRLSLACFISLISFSCSQTESPTAYQLNNPSELEEDYAPGFFDGEDLTTEDEEGGETHLLLEDQETMIEKPLLPFNFRFAQTSWDECSEAITGSYLDFACTKRRQISVILKTYMADHIYNCVDESLAASGKAGLSAEEIHITHVGITGDRNHSPRSLHAENRAIDIKDLRLKLSDGSLQQYTYSKLGNRPFYTALRKCWGRTVSTLNKCPLYRGDVMLTASIGWENRNHGQHMHLSLPYCINNRHGSFFWQR